MTDKIRYGLSTVFYLRDLIIGDITFNGKEVQTVVYYNHKSRLWVISNIFVYEEGTKEVKIKIDPALPLNDPALKFDFDCLSDLYDLYRFVGKITHVIYLGIIILVLTYNCGGTVVNILRQILSEASKSIDDLVIAILMSKYY
jgi:hypothetical protein